MSRRAGAIGLVLALSMTGVAGCGGGGGESPPGGAGPGGGGSGEDAPFYKECVASADSPQERENCKRLLRGGSGK